MNEWHERVFVELNELEAKSDALKAALSDPDILGKLSPGHYGLVCAQLSAMDTYAKILRLRLRDADFEVAVNREFDGPDKPDAVEETGK